MITTKKSLLAITLVSALGLGVAPTLYAQNDSEEKTESDSKGTEESEVSTEDGGEQEDVQSEGKGDLDTDTDVSTTVAKVESKLKQNLKKVAAEQVLGGTKLAPRL